MNNAEEQWNRFIKLLNEVDPLVFHKKDGSYVLPHENFLSSIKKYRKLFLQANPEKELEKINVEAPKEYVYIAPPT